jgi:NTP pyrophosphatase (non-canonical NTP hydrolase)
MDRLEHLSTELRSFVHERDWAKYHDPKNLAMLLSSEAGELLALFRWVRNEDADALVQRLEDRERIRQEIGDVGISLLLFCQRTGIDLLDAIEQKLETNRQNYPADVVRGRSDRPR